MPTFAEIDEPNYLVISMKIKNASFLSFNCLSLKTNNKISYNDLYRLASHYTNELSKI
jgi:hypothetical protein